MHAKVRLYLTADRSALVHEGDERGATLYAAPGDEIPEEAAKRFGLVDGNLKPAKGAKEDRGGKDKEDRGGQDKGGQGGGTKPDRHELTKIKGIGDGTAKVLDGAGIKTIAALAEIDPASPPTLEGLSATFSWDAVVKAAKELTSESGGEG